METTKAKVINKFEIVSGMYLLFLVLLILFTAGLSGEQLFLIVAGFFPTILVILVSLTMHEQYQGKNKLFWLIPVIIIGLFYLLGSQSNAFGTLNVDILTGVNFILSLIYVTLVFGLFSKLTISTTTTLSKPKKAVEKEKSIQDYINSIEDKSKALNFVVGRVYNKYHGGSDDLRNKLRIPSEWYNEFSELGVGTNKINFDKLDEIITKFELQLKNFQKSESEVFKNKTSTLKNLIRDVDGSDKIIDVLDHNDKDPVKSYYEGAVNFCSKIRREMKNQKIKLVKNSYIPTKEEEIEELKKKQKETEKSNGPKVTIEESKGPKHP